MLRHDRCGDRYIRDIWQTVRFINHEFICCYLLWIHYNVLFCRTKNKLDGEAFDQESSAVIKLNNSTILYLKEVNRYLALVCILREGSYERQGLYYFKFYILMYLNWVCVFVK